MEQLGAVDKAIDLLFHLQAASQPCGVTAIGRQLEMPKSSVHRLLTALVRRGLVERSAGGKYRIGVGLVALGLGALGKEPLAIAARPALEACAEEVGETFFLVAARARALVVLDKVEGNGFLRAAPRIGASVPFHATAVGKLYLAFAPEQREEFDTGERQAYTPHTLISEPELDRASLAIRELGYAVNRDEWINGLSVLAAPIWLAGQMCGAVALAAATPRMKDLGEDVLARQVVEAGRDVSRRLEGNA